MAKSIMIQGTGSDIGKSLLVAGLCRALVRRGHSVAPFKPQNMSNNAAVAVDGGEIGRAQALQAMAARMDPITDMNPVLLKPETETGSQVIVQGQRLTSVKASEYMQLKQRLLPAVMESFMRLSKATEFVIVEGAGSPAETNLRADDIANMGFAEAADLPVILTGDIDRGGVIAQIVGTHTVLSPSDRDRIKGFIVNKFRGDPSLFAAGNTEIQTRTSWTALGVVPWFTQANLLPAEDALGISSSVGGGTKIVVPQLSRIANFDDLDPLKAEPDVTLVMVAPGHPLPLDANLIILPGSKSTIGDLGFFRQQGWDIDLAAHVRRGGHVLGICGGYQMLGQTITDPDGSDGSKGTVAGLGHLAVKTQMMPEKNVSNVTGTAFDTTTPVRGYEIHIGITSGKDCARPWMIIGGEKHGATSGDGRILGTYVHGMFANDDFRRAMLTRIGGTGSDLAYNDKVENTLDNLADHLEASLQIDRIMGMAR